MKIVLMMAAGVAVGLTVVLAMVVQIVVQLLPLLVVLAVVMLALQLVRRRNGGQRRPADHLATFPYPVTAPVSAPALPAPATRGVDEAAPGPYLRWGPPEQDALNESPVTAPHEAGPQLRRTSAGSRPSGAARGRRP